MDQDVRSFAVGRCPACGLDHGEITFHHNRTGLARARPHWIALCPVEADPLVIIADAEGRESVVAFESATKRGLS